jgi:hypothetical protein
MMLCFVYKEDRPQSAPDSGEEPWAVLLVAASYFGQIMSFRKETYQIQALEGT